MASISSITGGFQESRGLGNSLDDVTPGQVTSFFFSCFAVLFAFNPFVGRPIPLAAIPTFLLALLALYFLLRERPGKRIWASWAMSSVCAVCATFVVTSTGLEMDMSTVRFRPSASLGVLMFAASGAMLVAHRYSVWLYVMLLASVGFIAYVSSASPLVSATAVLVYAIVLVLLNYIVKLCIDHARDIRLGMRLIRERPSYLLKLIAQSLLPSLVVVILIIVGTVLHDVIQNYAKRQIYAGEILPRSQNDMVDDADRDMRLDSYAALETHRLATHSVFQAQIADLAARGQLTADQVPIALQEVIQRIPPPMTDASGCAQLHIPPPRVFGVKIGGGSGVLADICRSAVGSLSNSIAAAYAAGIERLKQEVQRRTGQGKAIIAMTQSEALEKGGTIIDDASLIGRSVIEKIFLVIDGLLVFGWAVLISATIGAIALVIARRIFDHADGTPFSLGIGGGSQPLEVRFIHPTESDPGILEVANFPVSGAAYWYIFSSQKTLSRSGMGFDGVRIPQPLSCLFRRVLSRRYSMQRINATAAANAQAAGKDGARFGGARGSAMTLACIRVKQGQQVVFKFSHLAGFTAGVKLRSAYSTHVGLYLLGLGAFYSYAEGDGWLVLSIDKGSFKESERSKNFEYPHALVAWDRRAKFSVSHTTSVREHWFTESQVIPKSKDGTVLFGVAGVYAPGPMHYLWRLGGYLMLPF